MTCGWSLSCVLLKFFPFSICPVCVLSVIREARVTVSTHESQTGCDGYEFQVTLFCTVRLLLHCTQRFYSETVCHKHQQTTHAPQAHMNNQKLYAIAFTCQPGSKVQSMGEYAELKPGEKQSYWGSVCVGQQSVSAAMFTSHFLN